jgi:hypothetical protein
VIDEAAVDAALLAVVDGDGVVRGTAFMVGKGVALTCDHVVDGLDPIFVRALGADAAPAEVTRWPAIDVAALAVPPSAALLGLARATIRPPARFWTKGFQWSDAFGGPVPLNGTVVGIVSGVAYPPYRLASAFSLADDTIGPGLSGAPVLDADWGAVIGIVTAKARVRGRARGFAIPLAQSAAAEPSLAAICDENDAAVPRYGPYLNVAGARAVCNEQRRGAAARLVTERRLALDRYCERRTVTEALERFFAASHPVLPLIGPSGIGKTTELVHLAKALEDETALLFSAAELAPRLPEGLVAGLDSGLQAAGFDDRLAGVTALADTLRGGGGELLVLLDGLNETTAGLGPTGKDWLRRMTSWLCEHGARAIVTARPEYWSLVSSDAPDAAAGQGIEGTPIGDFSEEEARLARQRYALHDAELRSVGHPLLLRILSDLGEGAHLGLYDAVERYVDRQCIQAARASTSSRRLVNDVLQTVVSALDPRTLALERRTVLGLVGEHQGVVDALIDEHLIVDIGGGFRFAFDDIAEYLLARGLDADDAFRPETLAGLGERGVSPGALVMLIRRLDRDHGARGVRAPLKRMLEALDAAGGSELRVLVSRCLEAVRNAEELTDELLEFCEFVVRRQQFGALPVREGLLIESLRLPIEHKWAALRVLFRAEHGYEYECHHWDDFLPREFQPKPYSTLPQTARHLIEADPRRAWEALVPWLDDTTRLKQCAHVCEVAYALMYHFRDLAFDELLDVLTSQASVPWWFLSRLADADPMPALAVAQRWRASTSERKLQAAACLAAAVVANAEDPARRGAIEVLRTLLDPARPKGARLQAIKALVGVEETRGEVCAEVLERFAAGDPEIEPRLVGVLLTTHSASAEATLADEIAEGRSGRALEALMSASLRRAQDPAGVIALLASAEPADRRGHEGGYGVTVKTMLVEVTAVPDQLDALAAIAERVVRHGSDGARESVGNYAVGGARDDIDGALRDRLFFVLLGLPAEQLRNLPSWVSQAVQARPRLIDRLLEAPRPRISDVELGLRWAARFSEPCAEQLAARLIADPAYEPQHPRLAEFARDVRDGVAPRDAARKDR